MRARGGVGGVGGVRGGGWVGWVGWAHFPTGEGEHPTPRQTSNSEGGKRSMELSYESTELAHGILVKNIEEVKMR